MDKLCIEPVFELVKEVQAKDWNAAGVSAAQTAVSDPEKHTKLVYELVWHALLGRITAAQLREVLSSVPEIESLLSDAFWCECIYSGRNWRTLDVACGPRTHVLGWPGADVR